MGKYGTYWKTKYKLTQLWNINSMVGLTDSRSRNIAGGTMICLWKVARNPFLHDHIYHSPNESM